MYPCVLMSSALWNTFKVGSISSVIFENIFIYLEDISTYLRQIILSPNKLLVKESFCLARVQRAAKRGKKWRLRRIFESFFSLTFFCYLFSRLLSRILIL